MALKTGLLQFRYDFTTQEEPIQVETAISESQKRMRETLSIAQPFIASRGITFTLLSDYEITLSSTEVRAKRLNHHLDWKDMVAPSIRDYLDSEKLYI